MHGDHLRAGVATTSQGARSLPDPRAPLPSRTSCCFSGGPSRPRRARMRTPSRRGGGGSRSHGRASAIPHSDVIPVRGSGVGVRRSGQQGDRDVHHPCAGEQRSGCDGHLAFFQHGGRYTAPRAVWMVKSQRNVEPGAGLAGSPRGPSELALRPSSAYASCHPRRTRLPTSQVGRTSTARMASSPRRSPARGSRDERRMNPRDQRRTKERAQGRADDVRVETGHAGGSSGMERIMPVAAHDGTDYHPHSR